MSFVLTSQMALEDNEQDALSAGGWGQSVDKGVPPRWQNQDLFKQRPLLPGMGPSQCLRHRVSLLP